MTYDDMEDWIDDHFDIDDYPDYDAYYDAIQAEFRNPLPSQVETWMEDNWNNHFFNEPVSFYEPVSNAFIALFGEV